MTVRLSTAARNAAANAIVPLLDAQTSAGYFEVRSGTAPANPATAATGTVLATVTLSKPAEGSAATGVVTITDPAAVTASATGTATWARFYDGSANALWDCDVTATGGGGDLTLASTSLTSGETVDFGAITFTVPQ